MGTAQVVMPRNYICSDAYPLLSEEDAKKKVIEADKENIKGQYDDIETDYLTALDTIEKAQEKADGIIQEAQGRATEVENTANTNAASTRETAEKDAKEIKQNAEKESNQEG